MRAQPEPPAPSAGPESPPTPGPPAPLLGWRSASDLLGPWNFYFIAKLLLLWRGLIGFHLLENLALAAALALPLASPRLRRIRHWVAAPVALALLYYDSWLPGASRVLEKAGIVSSFSAAYLAELAGRFVSVPVLALLAVAAGMIASGLAWLPGRKYPVSWPAHGCLLLSVGLAFIGLLAGAHPVLMICGSGFALAAWDLVLLDGALGTSPAGEQGRRYEIKHLQSLALALGAGLLAAMPGGVLRLQVPFAAMLLFIALVLFGLDRVWRTITKRSTR